MFVLIRVFGNIVGDGELKVSIKMDEPELYDVLNAEVDIELILIEDRFGLRKLSIYDVAAFLQV